MIPYLGAVVGAFISVLLITITDPTKGLIFFVYILIVQQIDGNYIYPKLVGSKMGIDPIWIIIAVTLGGATGGLLGTIISVPLITTVYMLLKKFTKEKLSEKNIEIDKK